MTAKTIHAVTMPKWGIEMTEGTLTSWTAREGQAVGKGDPILEVETDKIINTVEAPAAGILRRITAAEGEVRPVGALIAVLADESVSDADVGQFVTTFQGASVSFEPDAGGSAVVPKAALDADAGSAARDGGGDDANEPRVSPIARRLAEKLGVDVSQIRGTGRNGRVSKEDVEAFAAAQPSTSNSNPQTRTKMSATRATIARRLAESKTTIPHYRVEVDAEVGRLQARRKQLAAEGDTKVSLNDMLVHCTARALSQHPQLNAHLDGDEIVQFARADIGIAVATAAGLITPVVRDAGAKSPLEIARIIAGLSERARRGALRREEISDGTFSISNLGMFGLTRFDAIINPPQVAILAVGAAQERVIARKGYVVIAQMLTLTLSADHRVVDGAVAAAFLASLRGIIEE
jgi:pyruvate dehydrogenase E2 component (dihydrolipoamide acetyltransferase)